MRMADIRILFNLSQYLQSGLINTVILPMLGANLRENAVGKRYFAAPSARPIIALNDSELLERKIGLGYNITYADLCYPCRRL